MNRRHFVAAGGLGALAYTLAGRSVLLTPREAHAANVSLQHFSTAERRTLAAFADHLLPGAAAAGVIEFIDHQVGVPPNECLLMCKYFPELSPPFAMFYRDGIAALDAFTGRMHAAAFADLTIADRDAVTEALWRGEAEGWAGPPPPLFYMMVRSDAVDVVYGTKAGFDTLNVPYMAHIMPPEKW